MLSPDPRWTVVAPGGFEWPSGGEDWLEVSLKRRRRFGAVDNDQVVGLSLEPRVGPKGQYPGHAARF